MGSDFSAPPPYIMSGDVATSIGVFRKQDGKTSTALVLMKEETWTLSIKKQIYISTSFRTCKDKITLH